MVTRCVAKSTRADIFKDYVSLRQLVAHFACPPFGATQVVHTAAGLSEPVCCKRLPAAAGVRWMSTLSLNQQEMCPKNQNMHNNQLKRLKSSSELRSW